MKTSSNILATFTAAIFSTSSAVKAANILTEDFEDNTVTYSTTSPEFHDGNTDYFTIVPLNGPVSASSGSAYAGFGGSNFFAAQDIDDGNTKPDTNTLTFTIGISGYENISAGTLFAAGGNDSIPGYDSNDGFLMRARIDAGPFQNLLAFEAEGTTNQLLRRDTDFDGVGDGFQPDHNFLAYNGLAVSGTGTTLTLEITVTSNDGSGEFAFDNVIIDGDLVIPEPSSALLALAGSALLFGRRRK
jgi:hypothetical protein